MDILLFNLGWMSFNIFLAFIPVLFGQVMLKNKYLPVRFLASIIWFIFLPNTIYLLTDVIHFFEDVQSLPINYLPIDLILYAALVVIGIATFVVSVYPFEKILFKKISKKNMSKSLFAIFGLNLLVGFGVVLGRYQRTNSWEIFTNTEKVISDTFVTITSVEFIVLAISFGVICQVIYSIFDKIKVSRAS